MSDIRVSSEAVQAAAASVAAKVSEFDARVSAVNSFVGSVVGDLWSGAAAEAFHADYQEWFEAAREVYEALSRVGSLLSSTSVTYADTESKVAKVSSDSSVSTVSTTAVGGR